MPRRIKPDHNQPSVAIEIPLEKPLPDYDLSRWNSQRRETSTLCWFRKGSATLWMMQGEY